MKSSIVFAYLAGLLGAGTAILAAPGGHQYTPRPGDPTEARVTIQNTPLPVQISGAPTITLSGSTTLQARLVRQTWEYRVISLPAGQTATGQQLAAAGADGWEAFGNPFPTSDGVSLLLKRPAH
jgi:hypothetical protein